MPPIGAVQVWLSVCFASALYFHLRYFFDSMEVGRAGEPGSRGTAADHWMMGGYNRGTGAMEQEQKRLV
jgi:hypothetical protein